MYCIFYVMYMGWISNKNNYIMRVMRKKQEKKTEKVHLKHNAMTNSKYCDFSQ